MGAIVGRFNPRTVRATAVTATCRPTLCLPGASAPLPRSKRPGPLFVRTKARPTGPTPTPGATPNVRTTKVASPPSRAMGVVMHRSFAGTDRQPQATTGNHSQAPMPFLGVVPALQMVQPTVIERATFSGCLADSARNSGLDDHEIAAAMHICAGYMSRFMRGVAQQWAKRLVVFMRVTNSLAPLQWLAHQMGCDLVLRDSRAAEVAALQQRLRELGGLTGGRCQAA